MSFLYRHILVYHFHPPCTCLVPLRFSVLCTDRRQISDLLKRHVTNHDEGRGVDVNKRQRTSQAARTRILQACSACAEAKLRCEGSDPCHRCEQKGLACQYSSRRSKISKSQEPIWTRPQQRPETEVTNGASEKFADQNVDSRSSSTVARDIMAIFPTTDTRGNMEHETSNNFGRFVANDSMQVPTTTTLNQGGKFSMLPLPVPPACI
jgi:Fungal Zn(2)-Cys(6) binuclear cluster domain